MIHLIKQAYPIKSFCNIQKLKNLLSAGYREKQILEKEIIFLS